ncbi:uncharacterized protein LOC130644562 [Hydractinia symbiolongicarpus]|uniref:uncharacterized protein LOC130644562 n=1 Tax=Hydractinia symbiolongicarpus TaxID=13093 RepID=UPI00254CDDDA|nr:uncharacterized protein LOC130644562 [Hydractinia symbiolongicarpus]
MTSEEVKLDISDNKEDVQTIPIHLKFKKLNASVEGKKILQDISGEIKPGEVLAIMGPSGAGKSTLLNLLSGREKGISLDSGKILINGQKATKRLRRGIGYVLQEDVFFSHLTVNQTLQFVGEVRLPDKLSKQQKHGVVNEVIDELGLRKCANTVMGGGLFVTGCSGGEKKRCSIGVELITNPSLLILDEPTSGLDSSTACNLINTVKKLAQTQNRAVVTTIHQPSSHVFHMFDKILLLCNGRIAYYGKLSGVLKFFEHIGMPCHINWNPADFIMEQLSAEKKVQDKIVQKFQEFKSNRETRIYCEDETSESVDLNSVKSAENLCNGADIKGHTEDDETQVNGKLLLDQEAPDFKKNQLSRWPTSFKTQTSALCKRAFIQCKRDFWDKLSFIQTFAIAVIAGLIWFNIPYEEKTLKDREGVVFFTVIYLSMTPMFFAIMTFPSERNCIAKERAAGMYRLSAYYTAKCISELPILLLQPVALYSIVYWMTGLNRSPVYLLGVFTIISVSILAQTFGLCIGGAIKNFKRSITTAIIFALSTMLLAGFYTKHIPYWLTWAKYVAHTTYAYNALIHFEFGYATELFKCSAESTFDVCSRNGTEYIHGADILSTITTVDLSVTESLLILWTYIVIFRLSFYLILRYLNKPK